MEVGGFGVWVMIVSLVYPALNIGYPRLEMVWYFFSMVVMAGMLCVFNLLGALRQKFCWFPGMWALL